MKRTALLPLLTIIAVLALPATALAQGECPSNWKPSGIAVGGLDELGPNLHVEVGKPPAMIETAHGPVNVKLEGSLIYVEPEPRGTVKRAWNTPRVTEIFEGPFGQEPYFVAVTWYLRFTGPGTAFDPYAVNYNGETGLCVAAGYTPYLNGVWPTHLGEKRLIR
jgi:hypothetical protein